MFIDTLANELRKRRKSYNLTQQDFADMVGVAERTVRAMEKGEGSIKIDTYLKAAAALGIALHIEVTP